MGKKYIIELPENATWIQWIMESTKDHHAYMDFKQVENLTPYTEPDLEQAKDEAYNDGYKVGREAEKVRQKLRQSDFEQIRKETYEQGRKDGKIEGQAETWICVKKIAVMDSYTRDEVFGEVITTNIIENYSASECIEKIRQYESEKDRQARIEYNFDEIKDVLSTTMKECNVSLDDIAEVLKKMKEAE